MGLQLSSRFCDLFRTPPLLAPPPEPQIPVPVQPDFTWEIYHDRHVIYSTAGRRDHLKDNRQFCSKFVGLLRSILLHFQDFPAAGVRRLLVNTISEQSNSGPPRTSTFATVHFLDKEWLMCTFTVLDDGIRFQDYAAMFPFTDGWEMVDNPEEAVEIIEEEHMEALKGFHPRPAGTAVFLSHGFITKQEEKQPARYCSSRGKVKFGVTVV